MSSGYPLFAHMKNAYEITLTDSELLDEISRIASKQPSGLEMVKECPKKMLEFTSIHNDVCPDCHGTGEIVSDMTNDEAIKLLKSLFQGYHIVPCPVVLPTGETVRVKK